jgi:hypothetical protein
LSALIDAAHVDLGRFLDYFKVDRLEHLPAVKFQEAEAKLRAKRPGNGGGKAAVAGKQPA